MTSLKFYCLLLYVVILIQVLVVFHTFININQDLTDALHDILTNENNVFPLNETFTDEVIRIPKVIIVGTQKGGTEAVRTYLQNHPQMMQSILHEPHFFDTNCIRCHHINKLSKEKINQIRNNYANEYFNLTELTKYNQNQQTPSNAIYTFEKTPMYLFHPLVPQRIRTIVPWSKIIMVLRDPVERAYSTFKMNYIRWDVANHEEEYGKVTFETCIRIDIKKLEKAGILKKSFWEVDSKEKEKRWLDYWNIWNDDFLTSEEVCSGEVGRGLYFMQIDRWWKVYNDTDSRNQILVMKSEHLLPNKTNDKIDLKPITDFIGIEEVEVFAKEKIHSYEGLGPMSDEIRTELRQLYEPFNRKLLSVLGNGWEDPWPYDL